MSASLVGSEMCIRDRAPWPLVGSSEEIQRGGRGREGGSPPQRRELAGSCLLYTSDAADDM
eukprot:14116300-Alexandrium_andersonii.AAC.1